MVDQAKADAAAQRILEKWKRERKNNTGCCGRPGACIDFENCAHRTAHQQEEERKRLGITESAAEQFARRYLEKRTRERGGLER